MRITSKDPSYPLAETHEATRKIAVAALALLQLAAIHSSRAHAAELIFGLSVPDTLRSRRRSACLLSVQDRRGRSRRLHHAFGPVRHGNADRKSPTGGRRCFEQLRRTNTRATAFGRSGVLPAMTLKSRAQAQLNPKQVSTEIRNHEGRNKVMKITRKHGLIAALASALMATSAYAQTTKTDIGTLDAATVVPGKPPGYSPYAGRNFPSRVFWGDTHLHTSASMDAGAFGNRLGFEDAYRFARGEELTASGGERVKLSRPLDFLVIADHSDNMGFFPALFAGKPEMLADPTGRRWYDMVQAGGAGGRQGGARDHRQLLARHVSAGAAVPAGLRRLPLDLGADHRRGGEVQRAGTLHRLHRLRVDLAGAARQQSAPRRDLSRRRRQGDPDPAVHDLSAAGQHDAGGSLEASPGLRGQDRRAGPGDRAQRQSLERLDVPDGDQPGDRPAAVGGVRRRRAPAGSRSTR